MMMSPHTKTAFTVIASIIVAVALILVFTFESINAKGEQEIIKYRAEEIHRIKQYLKDSVNIAYSTIEAYDTNSKNKAYLEKYYGQRLKNIIDVAETILKSKAEAVKKGQMTLDEAQAQAAEEIKNIRYDNGNGYIWITDATLPYPKMIMHPTEPSLDGQVLNDPKFNCALRKEQNLFSVAVEICQAHGKGFVDYLWPKQTQNGEIPDVSMLAYVRLFPEWNWILGTANYVDEANIDAREKSKDELRQMKNNNGIGSFWISSATKSDLRLIIHPTMRSLEGRILTSKLKDLYESFIDICEKKNGSGYKKYPWTKPTESGASEGVSKITYVRLYKPLGWIVGADINLDSVEQAVIDKQKFVNEQLYFLILKIVAISILVIFIIGVVIYIINRYLSYQPPMPAAEPATPEPPPAPVETTPAAAASMSMGENLAMTEDMPVLTPTHEQGSLHTDDCIRMVQEISKTLIAEHAKLLAMVIHKAAPSEDANEQEKVSNEVKKISDRTYQTIEDVKKMVEAKQEASHTGSENANSNQVMGNLNGMVGNIHANSNTSTIQID